MSPSLRSAWRLQEGVTYLNHGSFGPSPERVIAAREAWTRRLEANPMEFYNRVRERALDQACESLAGFVGTKAHHLLFVPNATVAMNLVAHNTRLTAGDDVLLTDHEYGAVQRIWRSRTAAVGARVVTAALPPRLDGDEEIIAAIHSAVTSRTKLVVVSHVASPTAAILPVAALCHSLRERGVPVCIDGPHAPGMVPVEIDSLGCDYYCASLHKWLSAPFGTGFLYVSPRRQRDFLPQVVSWGGRLDGSSGGWKNEFTWQGTDDPAAYLAVPTAIEFLQEYGFSRFRADTHARCRDVAERVVALTGLPPLVADSPERFGSMIALPLPAAPPEFTPGNGRVDPLQVRLWEEWRIEVPIVHWNGHRMIRVSCHLHTADADIDLLCDALRVSLEETAQ